MRHEPRGPSCGWRNCEARPFQRGHHAQLTGKARICGPGCKAIEQIILIATNGRKAIGKGWVNINVAGRAGTTTPANRKHFVIETASANGFHQRIAQLRLYDMRGTVPADDFQLRHLQQSPVQSRKIGILSPSPSVLILAMALPILHAHQQRRQHHPEPSTLCPSRSTSLARPSVISAARSMVSLAFAIISGGCAGKPIAKGSDVGLKSVAGLDLLVLSVRCGLVSAGRAATCERHTSGNRALPLGQCGRAALFVCLTVDEVAWTDANFCSDFICRNRSIAAPFEPQVPNLAQ